jgi:plastocyanin
MRSVLALALAAALAACSDDSNMLTDTERALDNESALEAAALQTEAEVEFGIEEGAVGTNFPPGSHDGSFHAFDKVRPHTVTIARGGSVTYEIYLLHQPAVFAPGTRPEDVDTSQTEPIPVFPALDRIIIDDPALVALAPDQTLEEKEWTTPPGTFDEPGKYLVICTTFVHFTVANMYGWVIVK